MGAVWRIRRRGPIREKGAGERLKCCDYARVFVQSFKSSPPKLLESWSDPSTATSLQEWTHHCLIFESIKDSGRVPDDGYPAVKRAESDSVSFVTSWMTQCHTNR